jgi:cellulose synthase/poly-beta-1,6-N-acetylglucosamine synthase-like glycosyltransferase
VFCPRALVYTERPATLAQYWHNELRWRRAHLASLFRLHEHFLDGWLSALRSLYFYGLAWFCVVFTCSVFALLLVGSAQLRITGLLLWALFLGWLCLRRAMLAIEVTTYTHRTHWLYYFWTPPFLLLVTLAAACLASLSLHRTTMHFKGPRHVGSM